MNLEALVVDAFAQLEIDAQRPAGASDGVDVVLDLVGVRTVLQVKRRALVTDEVAERLIREPVPADAHLFVVGDRVTGAARRLLTARGGGYYDLRGRLGLRTDRIVIDAEVEPIKGRSERSQALAGKVGLEVATALLMDPNRAGAVRELARELGRSASTVSDVLAALRNAGLLDSDNVVHGSELFWQVAERWGSPRTYLASMPNPGTDNDPLQPLGLNRFDVGNETGWALTDSVAAAVYGAPMAVQSGQLQDFFVPDESIVRRAVTLLGAVAPGSQARCSVRVAPVPAVCSLRVDVDTNPTEWPLAHPLFVALDLAQDIGRGREILEAWTPEARWARVW
ncbi:hypothetical protein NPS01_30730 [Nocardioides psychrotolerans]|uniref:Regulatory protein, arsR family n=1 Tax=Nocardioides psychrotolerans TaxID=1005945 RepID=A0A1I3NLS5_9ACTN|nr:ArsR family transcriptional regulator [Nocardioides psychrotolerans]GEP39410.1 hypothetical protein NPS01_30730 [Nocardioides psychrotolerans]SFJ10254.1 regulatory protein, arsR family [Nocardioides psychrotolerans]